MRIEDHPILGKVERGRKITLKVDGEPVMAFEGETIAAALIASGQRVFRNISIKNRPCFVPRYHHCHAFGYF
jgi:sarcosine oxidase subunit alpha